MGQLLDDGSFFQGSSAANNAAQHPNQPVRVKLDPHPHHATDGQAKLSPVMTEQVNQLRNMLKQLELKANKMRSVLQKLEKPAQHHRRATDISADRSYTHDRRRAKTTALSYEPDQLPLFGENFLQTSYACRPAELPCALDGVSIENFSISLAYGDDGMGIVGATLIALASGDSNGDGIIDGNDVYPDNSPVVRLRLDLNMLREGMMEKVRELVMRFDTNGNGRIDGPSEAFAFLRHVSNLEMDVDSSHLDRETGMITTESYIRAFGECLNRGLPE